MRHLPAFALVEKWLSQHKNPDTGRMIVTYDDVLDVFKGLLVGIPVDQEWYVTEYPAVADFVRRYPTETPTTHFQKHGYFEMRRPFDSGWRGMDAPVPFNALQSRLRIIPARGRLWVDIDREEFVEFIKAILRAVPVDADWYCSTYPQAAKAIADGTFSTAAEHFAHLGYFDGLLPYSVIVEEDWYLSRYEHVRIGLQRGVATSAQDHFIKVGYSEGCRPIPL